jgi:hypothetical protein
MQGKPRLRLNLSNFFHIFPDNRSTMRQQSHSTIEHSYEKYPGPPLIFSFSSFRSRSLPRSFPLHRCSRMPWCCSRRVPPPCGERSTGNNGHRQRFMGEQRVVSGGFGRNVENRMLTPEAGGPHTVTVTQDSRSITLNDVLIGEVWLCSGQSNMEMPLRGWPPADTIGGFSSVKDRWIRYYHSRTEECVFR